jgi:hypothetical protein
MNKPGILEAQFVERPFAGQALSGLNGEVFGKGEELWVQPFLDGGPTGSNPWYMQAGERIGAESSKLALRNIHHIECMIPLSGLNIQSLRKVFSLVVVRHNNQRKICSRGPKAPATPKQRSFAHALI